MKNFFAFAVFAIVAIAGVRMVAPAVALTTGSVSTATAAKSSNPIVRLLATIDSATDAATAADPFGPDAHDSASAAQSDGRLQSSVAELAALTGRQQAVQTPTPTAWTSTDQWQGAQP